MRRLLAAGLLPQRAGQPVKALVHTSLADLIQLDGSSALLAGWAAQVRARGRAPGRRVGQRQRRRAGELLAPGSSAPAWAAPACRWTWGSAATSRPRSAGGILRDQLHCRFPGGCDQPAAGCEVHHLTP